jgi:hypothetical protein
VNASDNPFAGMPGEGETAKPKPTAAQYALLADIRGGTEPQFIGAFVSRKDKDDPTVRACVDAGWVLVTERPFTILLMLTPAGLKVVGGPAPKKPKTKKEQLAELGAQVRAQLGAKPWPLPPERKPGELKQRPGAPGASEWKPRHRRGRRVGT